MEWKGGERRMSQDEQLGYMAGKLESVQNEMTEFKAQFSEHAMREEQDRVKLFKELAALKNMWSVRAATIKAFKFIGLGFIFLITFNFGDLAQLIKRLF